MQRATLTGLFVVLVACLPAYRALLLSAPTSGLPNIPPGAEARFFTPADTSPGLIFAVFAVLLIGRCRRFDAALGEARQVVPPLLLLGAAAALNLWSYYVSAPMLLLPSLTLMVLGAAWWLAGSRGCKTVLMPAFFLLLAYPIPAVLLNAIMFDQQLSTATGTAVLLNSLGREAVAQGDLILTPGRIFQVIESCAGIRTILTLLMSGLVYTELFYRSRLQTVSLVLATPFIGLAVNYVRILSLTLVPNADVTTAATLHTLQGVVMLVGGVLLIAVLDMLLARIIPPGPTESFPTYVPEPINGGKPGLPTRRVALLATFGVLLSAGSVVIQPWTEPRLRFGSVFQLPILARQYPSEGLELDREYLGSITFDEIVSRRFLDEAGDVDLVIGVDDRFDPRISLVSDKVAMPGPGSRIIARYSTTLEQDKRVNAFVLDFRRKPMLVFHWYENVDALATETLRSVLVLDRSMFRNQARTTFIKVATPIDRSPSGLQEADAHLRAFLTKIWPLLERVDAV